MHREPLWSDAQTYASGGLTVAALKGRADHGHRFQRTTNPFSDKRRTFDPYAQATEEGRAEYPWDAFKDPQYYGDADCSDGKLTAQCQEKPDQAKLDEKKAEWKQKYDEWYNPAEEEKKAAKEEGGAKKAVGGAMLKHAAEVLPWARRSYSQFRHSANRMKQAADRDIAAIADAGAHQQGTHYAGGEPVAASLGRVLKRVQGEVGAEGEMLHLPALGDLAHRFLRARRPDSEAWLGAAGGARLQELAGVGAGSTGKGGVSIWETPKQVSHHGLFGLAGAAPKHKAKQALVVPTGKAAKGRGPLPAVQAEAMRVLSEQHHRGAARAVKDHDAHMLEKVAGLSWSKMASLEDAAEAVEKEINPSVATPKAAKTAPRRAMQPWEEKVLQQGAMRHEGVEANLKHALGRRTVQLLKQKAGWQSEKELLRAEMFATNLEHAIKLRRTEEKKAPLMPADLNAAVDRAEGKKPRANRGRAHAESSKVAGEALKRLALPADDDAAADTPDVATPVASSKKAAAYTGKGGVPPVHGLSSAAADDEMDAYFATQAQHASSARVTK
ncbi:hypothetical protein T484DRAFT_2504674 [Baffinella frigidus]|nr:hypothetical protein T484DRAFT_2504674 [Cryptophyta sp. CCMP2293]